MAVDKRQKPDWEQRRRLVGQEVTLNGLPARVGGIRNDFATVTQLESGLGCEWAWETVEHIITNCDGKFNS